MDKETELGHAPLSGPSVKSSRNAGELDQAGNLYGVESEIVWSVPAFCEEKMEFNAAIGALKGLECGSPSVTVAPALLKAARNSDSRNFRRISPVVHPGNRIYAGQRISGIRIREDCGRVEIRAVVEPLSCSRIEREDRSIERAHPVIRSGRATASA